MESKKPVATGGPARAARVRKNMDMDPSKLEAARAVLGTDSDTDTVDLALAFVASQGRVLGALEDMAAGGGLANAYAEAPGRRMARMGDARASAESRRRPHARPAMPASYAIDTNLYIAASRDRATRAGLAHFTLRAGLRLYLSAVVVMELRAGARSAEQRAGVESLYAEFAGRVRMVVPSANAYAQAGRVLEELADREGFARATVPRSVTNDVLIAASCRERHVELVTANHRDFAAIGRHLRRFRCTAPWP